MANLLDHFRFGIDVETNDSVVVPHAKLKHWWLRGATGVGKDARCIADFLGQALHPYRGESGAPEEQCVIVIDLGGDPFQANRFRDECRRLNRVCNFLSLWPGHASQRVNLLQVPPGTRSLTEISSALVQGCGIATSMAYGEWWFAVNALNLSLKAQIAAQRQGRKVSLIDTYQALQHPGVQNSVRDGAHLLYAIELLLAYDVFADDGTDNDTINFWKMLENGECAYFFLPSITDPFAKTGASMLLTSIIAAAVSRTYQNCPRRVVRVVIDEAQELMSSSAAFGNLLVQARKHLVYLCMANQSTQQLRNKDASLVDVVLDNTNLQVFFTCRGDDDVEMLQAMSKDTTRWYENKNFADFRSTIGKREQKERLLERNTVIEVSATDGRAFVCRQFGGFEEPIIVDWPYVVSKAAYDELFYRPFPARQQPVPAPTPQPLNQQVPPNDPAKEERRRLLNELAQKLGRGA